MVPLRLHGAELWQTIFWRKCNLRVRYDLQICLHDSLWEFLPCVLAFVLSSDRPPCLCLYHPSNSEDDQGGRLVLSVLRCRAEWGYDVVVVISLGYSFKMPSCSVVTLCGPPPSFFDLMLFVACVFLPCVAKSQSVSARQTIPPSNGHDTVVRSFDWHTNRCHAVTEPTNLRRPNSNMNVCCRFPSLPCS